MKNIVILISGGGSNMKALVKTSQRDQWEKKFGAKISMVVSNQPDAAGLVWAQENGLKTRLVDHRPFLKQFDNPSQARLAFDQALCEVIDEEQPILVLLAGFMRILTPFFVKHYANRLINIHPSLLPAFPGLHTHERAMVAGCQFAGATVHRVTAELDHGPILAQAVVPILSTDTPQTLAQRVLSQEHRIYPAAIASLLGNNVHQPR